MEADYPSNHESGWMPILNLEVQMAKDKSIDFKWYKKAMASLYTILNCSAMPASTKRITLVQMGVTMLRNTRQELHPELRVSLLEHLAEVMLLSGYPEDYRTGILESAVACYELQVAASLRGEVPLYRPRDWEAPARKRRSSWPRAPGSALQIQFYRFPSPLEGSWPLVSGRLWRKRAAGWASR